MEAIEIELQDMIAEHKERKEALIQKKNKELDQEQLEVEQIEKDLNSRKDYYDKQIKALEEAWKAKIHKKKAQKEKLEAKLDEAKRNRQQELQLLEQKFEEHKKELDTRIREQINAETAEQERILQAKKEEVAKKCAQELQLFEDQQRIKMEQEKQAIVSKLQQESILTPEQPNKVTKDKTKAHHTVGTKTRKTKKLTDWSTTVDVADAKVTNTTFTYPKSTPLQINITTTTKNIDSKSTAATQTPSLSPIRQTNIPTSPDRDKARYLLVIYPNG
jgi:hypothetical protein